MAAQRRLRLAMLEYELAQARLQQNIILAALLEEVDRERHMAQRRRRRPLFGQYETLMRELENEHASDFKSYLRVEPALWQELLDRVGPRITKSQRYRAPLDPGLKLAITLRYLATGASYRDLAFAFRVAHNTITLHP
ncbi:hypothetical protein ScPMuIL_012411 [Solemya velum]